MATNFQSATPTLDAALAANVNYGAYRRCYLSRSAASVTSITATTGGMIIACRYPIRPKIPSVGTGCAGYIASGICTYQEDASHQVIVGLEYLLGTLTVSGNSFADGVTMPTKTIRGTSVTTAASLIFAVVDTALGGATTPTLTVTYTDQDGNTGNTATVVMPTNPALNTAFFFQNRLASGDTGIRDVTNLSISTGSSGVIKVYGVLPLYYSFQTPECRMACTQGPFPTYLCETNEYLGFYRLGSNTSSCLIAYVNLCPEPS